MKKIFVVVLLSLMSISCEKDNIDWAPFRIEFVILDSDGENIVLKDAEARSKVFIIYNNSRYICKELTRAVGYGLALTTTGSANEIFVFGDWSLNTDGSFRVRYGEQNWLVDFEYPLSSASAGYFQQGVAYQPGYPRECMASEEMG